MLNIRKNTVYVKFSGVPRWVILMRIDHFLQSVCNLSHHEQGTSKIRLGRGTL